MADESLEVLKSIDLKLSAVVTFLAEQHLRDTEPARYRPRSAERLLTDQGMSGIQVGRLLGKSKQAVSQAMARERRTQSGSATAKGSGAAEEAKDHDGR